MQDNKRDQEKALKIMEKRLQERAVAARFLEESEDEISRLSILLSETVEDKEIFGDIYFTENFGDDEDTMLLIFSFDVEDLAGISAETFPALGMAVGLLNAVLPLGGYGVLTDEEGVVPQMLQYTAQLPLSSSTDSSEIVERMEEMLDLLNGVLESTAGDLIRLAGDEISIEEYIETI